MSLKYTFLGLLAKTFWQLGFNYILLFMLPLSVSSGFFFPDILNVEISGNIFLFRVPLCVYQVGFFCLSLCLK